MKAWEIHKWLIAKKGNLRQVEKALNHLHKVSRINYQADCYFLSNRVRVVDKRRRREEISKKYLFQAKLISQIFKLIPWVKLVGISGNLAMENSSKKDDIDLFVIVSKKRLFLSRFFLLGILQVLGKRRKRGQKLEETAGKFCINLLLNEDSLAQDKRDIYLAHEILQMRLLWQREGIYTKYLSDNQWVFKYLPNWVSAAARGPGASVSQVRPRGLTRHAALDARISLLWRHPSLLDLLENLARWLQLKYMGKPQGLERISSTALYFHPQDWRPKILKEYKKRLTGMKIT